MSDWVRIFLQDIGNKAHKSSIPLSSVCDCAISLNAITYFDSLYGKCLGFELANIFNNDFVIELKFLLQKSCLRLFSFGIKRKDRVWYLLTEYNMATKLMSSLNVQALGSLTIISVNTADKMVE